MEELKRRESMNNRVESRLNSVFISRNDSSKYLEDPRSSNLAKSRLAFLKSINEENTKKFAEKKRREKKKNNMDISGTMRGGTRNYKSSSSSSQNNHNILTEGALQNLIDQSKRRRIQRLAVDYTENLKLTNKMLGRRKTLKDVASTVVLKNQICGTLFSETIKIMKERRRKVVSYIRCCAQRQTQIFGKTCREESFKRSVTKI